MLAAILLLLRRRWALHVFELSLAVFVVSLIYTYGVTTAAGIMGQQVMVTQGMILAGCVFFVWYAWAMTKRGLLR